MAADTQTLQYIITFKTMGVDQAVQTIKAANASIGGSEITYTKVSKAATGLGMDIGRLASRAAITIPIWLAMRSSFMTLLQTIGDGATYIVEFNKEMAQMATLSSGVANIPMFMRALSNEVRSLSNTTGKSVAEVSSVYKAFAETGMNANDALNSMTVAMKLSIATFTDSKQTARMMVDLYKLFGDTMDRTLTPQQKMESLAGSFVVLWRENAGTLGEYINALKMFAPIAKNYNLSIDQTLATTIVLHNYMQRSTMAGTQLARSFSEMSKNADKFDAIGIKIAGRTDWMNIFLETLTKLSKIEPGKRGTLMSQLFGERSVKGTAAMASYEAISKLSQTLYELSNMDASARLKVLDAAFNMQNETLKVQIDRFKLLKAQMGEAFITGITGTNDFTQGMKKLNDFIQGTLIPTINTLAGAIRAVGIALMFTTAIRGLQMLKGAAGTAATAGVTRGVGTAVTTGLSASTQGVIVGGALAGMTTASVGRSIVQTISKGGLQAGLQTGTATVGGGAVATALFTKFFGPTSKIAMIFMGLNSLLGPLGWTIIGLVTAFDLVKRGQEAEIDKALIAAKEGKTYKQFYQETQKNPSWIDWMVNPQRAIGKLETKFLNPEAKGKTPEWYNKLSNIPVIGGLARRAFGQQFAVRDAMTAFEATKGKGPVSPEDQAKADAAQEEWIKIRMANVQRLKAYGFDTLTLEQQKLAILKDEWKTEEDNLKIKEQELKVLEAQIAAVNEIASVMQTNLQGAFKGILSGTQGFSSIGKAISDSMVEGVRTTLSEGLTNVVMATGIGDMFGMSMSTIKQMFTGASGGITGAFEKGGEIAYKWIIKAFNYGGVIAGGGSKAAAMANAATAGMSGGASGVLGSMAGTIAGMPLFSYSTGGGFGSAYTGTDAKQKAGNVTAGNIGGSLMTGYGMYQSTRQSGGSKGMGLLAGGLGAAGALAGTIALAGSVAAVGGAAIAGGSMAGMMALGGALLTNPVGWVALGLMAAAVGIMMIAGGKKKTKVDTTIQEQTTVNEVASKIDITNKKLELVNRNLVALRNTMETYIMPTSTYFQTARNLEDEFSLSARRG